MASRPPNGFTLIELLLALLLFVVGVLAFAGATGANVRLLNLGRGATGRAQRALNRLELLRATARADCSLLASGSTVYPDGLVERWSVGSAGPNRQVLVVLDYPAPRGPASDSLAALLECP